MMKHCFSILIAIIFISINLKAQTTITMEVEAGVYKVPCTVNGARMKFIFDTGAASVSISKNMVDYLLENDYISESDFTGYADYQVADGRIVKKRLVNLKDVSIGGMHIYNVEACVSPALNAPLLLGQSAIQKLGPVTINKNQIVIGNKPNNAITENNKNRNTPTGKTKVQQTQDSSVGNINKTNEKTNSKTKVADTKSSHNEVEIIKQKIGNLYSNSAYDSMIPYLKQLQEYEILDEEYLYYLAYAYHKIEDHENCINTCEIWLRKYADINSSNHRGSILYYFSHCCQMLDDTTNKIYYFKEELKYETDLSDKALTSLIISGEYLDLEDYDNSVKYAIQALDWICSHYGLRYLTF